MSPRLAVDPDRIATFCQKWKIAELDLFGSVLRDDFRPDSDIDLLVTFKSEARWSLFDRVTMTEELAVIMGREVDLVNRKALERSSNWLRKRAILETTEPLYVAAG